MSSPPKSKKPRNSVQTTTLPFAFSTKPLPLMFSSPFRSVTTTSLLDPLQVESSSAVATDITTGSHDNDILFKEEEEDDNNNNNNGMNLIAETTDDGNDKGKDILSLLYGLFSTHHVSQALIFINKLLGVLDDHDDDVKKTNAQKIANVQGLSIIIFAIKKYEASIEFVSHAVDCLVKISHLVPEIQSLIVDLQAIEIIMNAYASSNKNNSNAVSSSSRLSGNIIGLLYNISSSEDLRLEISTNKIIDFCMQLMKKFPDDSNLQKNGCLYLHNIMKIEAKKEELLGKDIASLLSKTLEHFRERDQELHAKAKEVLKFFLDLKEENNA